MSLRTTNLKASHCEVRTIAFNRIHFQHGMWIPELFRNFGTETQWAQAMRGALLTHHYVVGQGAFKLLPCNGYRHQIAY